MKQLLLLLLFIVFSLIGLSCSHHFHHNWHPPQNNYQQQRPPFQQCQPCNCDCSSFQNQPNYNPNRNGNQNNNPNFNNQNQNNRNPNQNQNPNNQNNQNKNQMNGQNRHHGQGNNSNNSNNQNQRCPSHHRGIECPEIINVSNQHYTHYRCSSDIVADISFSAENCGKVRFNSVFEGQEWLKRELAGSNECLIDSIGNNCVQMLDSKQNYCAMAKFFQVHNQRLVVNGDLILTIGQCDLATPCPNERSASSPFSSSSSSSSPMSSSSSYNGDESYQNHR